MKFVSLALVLLSPSAFAADPNYQDLSGCYQIEESKVSNARKMQMIEAWPNKMGFDFNDQIIWSNKGVDTALPIVIKTDKMIEEDKKDWVVSPSNPHADASAKRVRWTTGGLEESVARGFDESKPQSIVPTQSTLTSLSAPGARVCGKAVTAGEQYLVKQDLLDNTKCQAFKKLAATSCPLVQLKRDHPNYGPLLKCNGRSESAYDGPYGIFVQVGEAYHNNRYDIKTYTVTDKDEQSIDDVEGAINIELQLESPLVKTAPGIRISNDIVYAGPTFDKNLTLEENNKKLSLVDLSNEDDEESRSLPSTKTFTCEFGSEVR